MKPIEIIPRKFWFNHKTSARVSIFGGTPWGNATDEADWELMTSGYSIVYEDHTGERTVRGFGAMPTDTLENAKIAFAKAVQFYESCRAATVA